jgi:Na+(H+)/acetate symporter ActP
MLVGGAVAIGMSLTGNSRFLGIHAGVLGMLLNFFIAIAISLMTSSKEDEVQSFGEKFVKLFK